MIIRLVAPDLVRLALVVAVASASCLALGLIYPVQRELDTAATARADFATVSEVEIHERDLPRVVADFGPEVLLVAEGSGEFSTPSGRGADARIFSTATPASDIAVFPPETVLTREAVGGIYWADISADLAQSLRVAPGDEIALWYVDEPVPLTVRGVYAARPGLTGPAALIPADIDYAMGWDAEMTAMTTLYSEKSPGEVRELLASPMYQDRLAEAGYVDDDGEVVAEAGVPRSVLVADAEDASDATLGLITAVSVLAVLGGLGFIIREVLAFLAATGRTVQLLHGLGCSRSHSRRILVAAVATCTGMSMLGAVALARVPYQLGLLGPAVPPVLEPVIWLAAGAGLIVGVATLAVAWDAVVRDEARR